LEAAPQLSYNIQLPSHFDEEIFVGDKTLKEEFAMEGIVMFRACLAIILVARFNAVMLLVSLTTFLLLGGEVIGCPMLGSCIEG